MSYVWKDRLTIVIDIAAALIFMIGVFTVANKFLNFELSSVIGILGFGLAVMHLNAHRNRKERLARMMQDDLEQAGTRHKQLQEYQRQQREESGGSQ